MNNELTVKRIVFDFLDLKEEFKIPNAVPVDKSFTDLGADSLDCMEIVMQVEEELEVSIPDVIVTADDFTIQGIMKYVGDGL